MSKYKKGDAVIVIPRSLGAEVVEPDLPNNMVHVKFATINPIQGKVKIWHDTVPEDCLMPVNKKKGVIII